ncbi:hypothetical protein PUN28_019949 [Cardiocondyla obscurior]|uniref:Uncharacterized protein n=1 Tax=Cardiocondyla obscurior TaxID=286306 RepID=A0AAW2ECA2_9HYME
MFSSIIKVYIHINLQIFIQIFSDYKTISLYFYIYAIASSVYTLNCNDKIIQIVPRAHLNYVHPTKQSFLTKHEYSLKKKIKLYITITT